MIGFDNETGLFASVDYRFRTTGNGAVNNGLTGFTPDGGSATLSTVSGVTYEGYLSEIPNGSILTGATLDFYGLFGAQLLTSPVTGVTVARTPQSAAFYQPVFAATLGAYNVTITSLLANVTVVGSAAQGYNLWPLFENDLVAGNAINVQWSAVEAFSANFSSYEALSDDQRCVNCDEKFTLGDTRSFTADQSRNFLTLSSTIDVAQTNVPEPVSTLLVGFGLMATAFTVRRCRR